jgi:SAM-dependent methyltransferase
MGKMDEIHERQKMSQTQNIYDNQIFFEGYRALRERDDNHNILIEQPAMLKLLPDLNGKTVLDLGCGCGGNCLDFIRRGAKHVVGIDVSENMLAIAHKDASDSRIEYRHMDMAHLGEVHERYDLIYSSLAFHYIEDFERLCCDIYDHLNEGGTLLFSQEHPLNTADGFFNKDESGNVLSYTVYDYNRSGKRVTHWFVDGVEKYHRPMGEILTSLAQAGFIIENVCEPVPEEWALQKRPALIKEYTKPCFLIVRAKK